jgi:XapX domain-containing protein
MKSMIGIVLAFALGFACRAFGIPSPAPPLILGALLVMTMTIGYIAVDRWMASPARHARDCGGPSGLSASQALSKGAGHWAMPALPALQFTELVAEIQQLTG